MWTFRYVDPGLLGPVRTAKMIKIMAHRFLRGYEASIYLDNTIRMVAPYAETFARLERSDELDDNLQTSLAILRLQGSRGCQRSQDMTIRQSSTLR